MNPPLTMKEGDGVDGSLHKPRHLLLRELLALLLVDLNQVGQGPSVHQLHHDPQAAIEHVRLEVLHHVGVSTRLHHCDLVLKGREVGLLGESKLLDRIILVSLGSFVNRSHSSLPNALRRHLVMISGVLVQKLHRHLCLHARLLSCGQTRFTALLLLESEHVDDRISVLQSFCLGDVRLLQQPVPPGGQACEARGRRGVDLHVVLVLEVEGSADVDV
mmetsp:Transcript_6641/g.15224  ORF Transcript_6641/g.15224 Transcript_6641/m.15224 type:complete len:217 (-) Transcript_6641:487-1137(-)